jgi:hypothetical protein
MAHSHSALRSAASRYECVQPLRAAVGRKVERIINVGSVHTAHDVARSEAARRGDKPRHTVIIQYSVARHRRRSPLNAADRAVSRYERVQQLRAADRARSSRPRYAARRHPPITARRSAT